MFELRWVDCGPDVFNPAGGRIRQLEYRVLMPCVDATGALCPGEEWTAWQVVPTVPQSEAEET